MTNATRAESAEPADNSAATLPLHQFLTYRLARVQAKLNTQANRITLTQWRVIALVGAAGQARLSDLAKAAALDKGLLSRAVKTLVEDGSILTRTDENDHRAQVLSLSGKGQQIFERTLPVTRARQHRLREGLTEEELAVFRQVLDKLEIAAEK